MKHLLTLCLLAVTMCVVAQEKKTVAVLDPIDRQQTVPTFLLTTIRMTMETAITLSEEYEAFDRSALDKLKQEQSFQRSGDVNDNTIKKIGQLTGVNFVLVSEVSGGDGYIMISAKVMDVETGHYGHAFDTEFVEMKPQDVQKAARGLAVRLFGLTGSMSTPMSSSSINNSSKPSNNNQITNLSLEEEEEDEEVIFVIVEEMPEFPGGETALFQYLSENVKYPAYAQENGIQGRVICQFVVNKDGAIVDIEVIRSGGDPSLDAEAIRVIRAMPRWKPGKQRGKAVRVKYTVPINFRLQ